MKNYASKGKRIGLLLAMLFITSWMFAQVTVTGNVRDERDEGAIGATVLLVGSQKGTISRLRHETAGISRYGQPQ